jgi:hypothetical protein
MTDKPITFSAPMVRALLDGPKTQTRRVTTQPRFDAQGCHLAGVGPQWWDYWSSDRAEVHRFKVLYAPGDRLYVREQFWSCPTALTESGWDVHAFRADDDGPAHGRTLRPSIHMPRWASRITLTVTEVRVQRLQDISEADATAEGVVEVSAQWQDADEPATFPSYQAYGQEACFSGAGAARLSFMTLWNSLHGPEAWGENPWVAAVSFTVEQRNIDAGAAE